MKPKVRKNILALSATAITLLAAVTLFMSGSVMFDMFDIRAREGNFVWFIVIVNFICGIIYLFAGYGFFEQRRWTTTILAIATVLLLLAMSGLIIYIANGLPFESRTVKAMVFRIFVTVLFTGVSWRLLSGNRQLIV